MYTVEEAYRSASELYWIAFLLTGYEELSLQVTMNALGSENGLGRESSSALLAILRRTVIQNALAATQAELFASARRFAPQRCGQSFITTTDSPVDSIMSKAQI